MSHTAEPEDHIRPLNAAGIDAVPGFLFIHSESLQQVLISPHATSYLTNDTKGERERDTKIKVYLGISITAIGAKIYR